MACGRGQVRAATGAVQCSLSPTTMSSLDDYFYDRQPHLLRMLEDPKNNRGLYRGWFNAIRNTGDAGRIRSGKSCALEDGLNCDGLPAFAPSSPMHAQTSTSPPEHPSFLRPRRPRLDFPTNPDVQLLVTFGESIQRKLDAPWVW